MKFIFKMILVSLVALGAAALLFFIQYRGLKEDLSDYRARRRYPSN